jgi:translation initiation factor 1
MKERFMEDEKYKLVFSSSPKQNAGHSPKPSKISVRLERKGRGGKCVTLIENLPHWPDEELRLLLKDLQKYCGTGGTFKDRHLEIQGQTLEKVRQFLQQKGLV